MRPSREIYLYTCFNSLHLAERLQRKRNENEISGVVHHCDLSRLKSDPPLEIVNPD